MEYNLNDQSTANCIIGINIRIARSLCPLGKVPFCDGFIIEPKSDVSSICQGLVILLPVADTVIVFFGHKKAPSFYIFSFISSFWYDLCRSRRGCLEYSGLKMVKIFLPNPLIPDLDHTSGGRVRSVLLDIGGAHASSFY